MGILGELRGSESDDLGRVNIRPGFEKVGFGQQLNVDGRRFWVGGWAARVVFLQVVLV